MITKQICGVEFTFTRQTSPRNSKPYWQVAVTKTGTVLECFPGKTLADKERSIMDTARVIGLERFKRETETAQ